MKTIKMAQRFCWLVLALMAAGQSVQAKGTLSFSLDNDLYFGTDREYSNGGAFSYTAQVNEAPNFLKRFLLKPLGAEDFQMRYHLGQTIYTPNDKQETDPLPGERPYAALLYGQVDATFEKATLVHRLSLQAGWFGPPAIGRQIQNTVHSIRGLPKALGWRNQIRFEPALNLHYDVTRPTRLFGSSEGFALDIEPFLGLSLGNVTTSARAGFMFRFGSRLDGQPASIALRPGVDAPRLYRPSPKARIHFYAGASGQVEAYSTLVEGNIFRSSLSAPAKTLQWEARFGTTLSIGRYWMGIGANAISRMHDFQKDYIHGIGEIRFGVAFF